MSKEEKSIEIECDFNLMIIVKLFKKKREKDKKNQLGKYHIHKKLREFN